jgi:hypothetical protein
MKLTSLDADAQHISKLVCPIQEKAHWSEPACPRNATLAVAIHVDAHICQFCPCVVFKWEPIANYIVCRSICVPPFENCKCSRTPDPCLGGPVSDPKTVRVDHKQLHPHHSAQLAHALHAEALPRLHVWPQMISTRSTRNAYGEWMHIVLGGNAGVLKQRGRNTFMNGQRCYMQSCTAKLP